MCYNFDNQFDMLFDVVNGGVVLSYVSMVGVVLCTFSSVFEFGSLISVEFCFGSLRRRPVKMEKKRSYLFMRKW